LKLIGV